MNIKKGLILGSGLGVLADEIEDPIKVPYQDIPHFPVSTVSGHAGQLVFGHLNGKQVVAMQGRFHAPEIGLATVYRTLELLADLKIVDKIIVLTS